MDHFSIDIHYNEEEDSYRLIKNSLSPIPDDEKSEKKADPFMIDNYPELTWLEGFRVKGYPDVIRVPFGCLPSSSSMSRHESNGMKGDISSAPSFASRKWTATLMRVIVLRLSISHLKKCIIFDVQRLKKETGLSGLGHDPQWQSEPCF
jgi:hypothetical protein